VGSIATDDVAELVEEIRVVFFENCYLLRQFFADPLSDPGDRLVASVFLDVVAARDVFAVGFVMMARYRPITAGRFSSPICVFAHMLT
jgi:hypothetical protein